MFHRAFYGFQPYHRPYRFFWFVLGGGAATLWMKHKEVCAHDRQWGHCVRVPVRPPPFLQAPGEDSKMSAGTASPHAQTRFPASPQPLVFGNQQAQTQQWEEEKARMLALSRQAGDTMTDLSEATLDSVLSTVETLKAKLAEHRAQRERQQKQLDEEFEALKKNPVRFV